MLMEKSPKPVGVTANSRGFAPGIPAGLKRFHVAVDSLHDSVTWYTSWVTPLFVTMSSRLALKIVEPAGTCPEFEPMKSGNLTSVLHTVLEDVLHPDPSTRSFVLLPKFVSGAPLLMYASSVSLNGPPSPCRKVRGATEAVRPRSSAESIAPAGAGRSSMGTEAPIAEASTKTAT